MLEGVRGGGNGACPRGKNDILGQQQEGDSTKRVLEGGVRGGWVVESV